MSKGSKQRPTNIKNFSEGYDRIFNKREEKMSVNSESIHAWTKLRNAMSKLDYMIPEDAFQDEDEGQELADAVSDVWDKIVELQRYYGQFHMVKKDNKEE